MRATASVEEIRALIKILNKRPKLSGGEVIKAL